MVNKIKNNDKKEIKFEKIKNIKKQKTRINSDAKWEDSENQPTKEAIKKIYKNVNNKEPRSKSKKTIINENKEEKKLNLSKEIFLNDESKGNKKKRNYKNKTKESKNKGTFIISFTT